MKKVKFPSFKKNGPKILMYIFLTVFIIQIVILFFLLVTPNYASAQTTLQVPIGNQTEVKDIAEYIPLIFNYSMGFVGILAAVVLMFGGVMWLTAGGNQGQVGEAKEWIKAALTGLILALLSFLILNTINPDLIKLKMPTIKSPEPTAPTITTKDEAYLQNVRQTDSRLNNYVKSTNPTRTIASNQEDQLNLTNYTETFSEYLPNNMQRTFYVSANTGKLVDVREDREGNFLTAYEYNLTQEAIDNINQSNNPPNTQLQVQLTDEEMKAINP